MRDRWINAIAKADAVIMEGDPTFLHSDTEKEILYYRSSDSGEIYETTETCQCPAFLQNVPQPCYHCAMRRLVKSYFKFLKKPGEIYKRFDQIDYDLPDLINEIDSN